MTTPAPSSGGGNVWTRKYGIMPLWAWGGIVVLLAVVYSLYRKHTAAAASQQNQSNPSVNSPGGVDASLVPQFVNQVYTQGTPPPAPNITVNNQIPPDTEPGPVTTPPSHAPPKVHQYPAPQGVSAKKVSGTSAKITFKNLTSPQPAPSSYTIAVYQSGKVVEQQTINPDAKGNITTATITGLPANAKNLTARVWANGGALAPPGTNVGFSLLWQTEARKT
jgi:hypothetical protein